MWRKEWYTSRRSSIPADRRSRPNRLLYCEWVMDRGMTSEDNLEWLRETGRRYLVGTPKSELKKRSTLA